MAGNEYNRDFDTSIGNQTAFSTTRVRPPPATLLPLVPAPGVSLLAPRCPPWHMPCQGVARGTPRQPLASAGGRKLAIGQHRLDGGLGTARRRGWGCY
jgi:hypothetical protein